MWLALCINLNVGLLQMQLLRNGDKRLFKKPRRAVIKTRFDGLFYVLPKRRRQCYGLYRGQLHFLE
jgi:hypothetical protein